MFSKLAGTIDDLSKSEKDNADSIIKANADNPSVLARDPKEVKMEAAAKTEQLKMFSEFVQKSIRAGKSGDALAEEISKSGMISVDALKDNIDYIGEIIKKSNPNYDVEGQKELMKNSLDAGDVSTVLYNIQHAMGDQDNAIPELAKLLSKSGYISQEAKDRAADKSRTESSLPSRAKVLTNKQEAASVKDSDIERIVTAKPLLGAIPGTDQKTQESLAGAVKEPIVNPAAPSPVVEAQKQTAEAVADHHDSAEKHTDDLSKQNDRIGSGIESVDERLNKGIKYDQAWLNNKWKKALSEGTLDSFRTALMEYAVLNERLSSDKEFKQSFDANLDKISEMGGGVNRYSALDQDKLDAMLGIEHKNAPPKAAGGPINTPGLYSLHRGEYVMPAADVKAAGAGSNRSINANITINGSQLNPDQLKNAVYGALDQIARRS
jgi:hypothetical protein